MALVTGGEDGANDGLQGLCQSRLAIRENQTRLATTVTYHHHRLQCNNKEEWTAEKYCIKRTRQIHVFQLLYIPIISYLNTLLDCNKTKKASSSIPPSSGTEHIWSNIRIPTVLGKKNCKVQSAIIFFKYLTFFTAGQCVDWLPTIVDRFTCPYHQFNKDGKASNW
jgi:hypothetical protein